MTPSRNGRPRIVATMGDPAGIGPEVLIRALGQAGRGRDFDVSIVGSRAALSRWEESLSSRLPDDVEIVDVGDAPADPGTPTAEGARAALSAIERAARMCLDNEADAMVTAPVSKAAITSLGTGFSGHTEFLAELTGASDHVMTFVHGESRIGLATTHLPLSSVPGALTVELVVSKLRALDRGLREWFGVPRPSLAVAALNPHAGEGGEFGDEERVVLVPAIREAGCQGVRAEGPFPADALFAPRGRDGGTRAAGYDAVLAMYHDQGTIAAKLLAGGCGVNVTLGLPIVRTSVDHGTAFDVAGAGGADAGSMAAALSLAAEIALRRRGPAAA